MEPGLLFSGQAITTLFKQQLLEMRLDMGKMLILLLWTVITLASLELFPMALGTVEEKLKICVETSIPKDANMGKLRLEYEFGSSCQSGGEIALKNGKCEFTSQVKLDTQDDPKENFTFTNYSSCNDVPSSGIYTLKLGNALMRVFCEEQNGTKYLVIQRRLNGHENFYRNWTEYEDGFGNLTGEFWIGNKALNSLTSRTPYKLLIEMEAFDSTKAYARYEFFSIDGPETKYKLNVAGYSGNAGDSLSGHNGQKFSTFDQDNDNYNGNCVELYKGAWWHTNCHDSNLNGLYHPGGTNAYALGVNWKTFRGYHESMKTVVMKIFKDVQK